MAIKEISTRVISAQPVLMPQEVMDFIRKYQLFEFDVSSAKLVLLLNAVPCKSYEVGLVTLIVVLFEV